MKNKKLLKWLILFLGFVLPFLFLVVAILIFNKNRPDLKFFPKEPELPTALTPSQVLNDKSRYHQRKIVIQGRVQPEPVVCEQRDCPANERCCGCPEQRNLCLYDTESVLGAKSQGRLRLVGPNGESFCRREPGSCQYQCGDWLENAVYNISGKFFAESPPPGWRLSLDYYFQVEEKTLLEKIGWQESFINLINEIGGLIKNLSRSDSFVLP